jgi:hypothetical protein
VERTALDGRSASKAFKERGLPAPLDRLDELLARAASARPAP